eukprot:6214779-Pleurochrysis_carterae.AAC.1
MNIIEPNLDVENGSCGLIPLGGRCEGVITTGCGGALAAVGTFSPRLGCTEDVAVESGWDSAARVRIPGEQFEPNSRGPGHCSD